MTAAGRESPLQGWFTPRGRGDRESGENYAPAVISTNKRGAETRGTRAPTSLAMFTREGANYFSKCHSLPPPRYYLIPSLFFFFFFSSLLLFPSLFPSPTTEPRGLDTVVRSLCEGWRARGGNGMNRCCCWFLGAGLFFFFLSSFFSFFRSLFLYGARITRGKLNFCNVRTSGGVRNSSFERSIDIGFRFVVVASILGATRFRPCTSCTLRED